MVNGLADGGPADVAVDVAADVAAEGSYEAGDGSDASWPFACDASFTQCGLRCVDLTTDPLNCGACNRVCPAGPNAAPSCASSICGLSCAPGFEDCNGNPSDGCEANLQTDSKDCGLCGRACTSLPNAFVACSKGVCGVGACNPGFADCNGFVADGCEANLGSDSQNCGACKKACGPTQTCTAAACACASAEDTLCDGACTDFETDPNNCGGCGDACVTGQKCVSGKCACPSTAPTLCDGVCSDTESDPNNCGGCGVVCLDPTTSCAGGTCVPPPVTLVGGQTNPGAIALDSTYVYWVDDTDAGSLMRIPKANGHPTTLAQGLDHPYALAVDSTSVYFTTYAQLLKVPIAGGTPTVLATETANAVALSGSTLVVGSADIQAFDLAGDPTIILLGTGQNDPRAVAADSRNAYWITTAGVVASAPIATGGMKTLASGQGGYYGIAVDASNVYFTNSYAGTVASVPIGGGGVTTLATGQTNPQAIAVAGGYVYWANATNAGSIMKVGIAAGAPTTVAANQANPTGIAVDDAYVYWTTTSGAVMMTAR
jgi:hypothetical protein